MVMDSGPDLNSLERERVKGFHFQFWTRTVKKRKILSPQRGKTRIILQLQHLSTKKRSPNQG